MSNVTAFPKVVKKTADLLAEASALPVSCRISGKQLVPALAPVYRAGTALSGVIYAGYSVATGRYFLCNSSYVYVSTNGYTFTMLNALAGSAPYLIEDISGGAARAVVINGENAVQHTGSSFKAFIYGANLCCGTMHCGRLFGADGTDKTKICWSGEGGLGDWVEGLYGSGSLKLDPERGEICDVLEYGEKLVLVRKYGLTVLKAYGQPANYSVEITDTDCDEILKGTARVVGGKLIFYTASGLHSYDGTAIKKISHRCEADVSGAALSAEFCGKYFLSCTSKSLGGGALLCYDPSDGESYLIDVAADAMCVSDCVNIYKASDKANPGSYALSEGGNYTYFCKDVNFGTDKNKTVTEIYVECDGADVEISNGRITRKFTGVSGRIRPRLRGRSFTVKVTGNCTIKNLSATAEVSVGI